MIQAVLGKAVGAVISGVAGVTVVNAARSGRLGRVAHQAAVGVTAAGLRAVRAAEHGAENTRLVAADIVAEAREKVGEQATPPGAPTVHDHQH
ncbi:DUF1490 family protein [Nakamurella deserti]|uniref:DUF1490 family protein n=1 Tax=Nakamurella deserti TaxID=2164074 RepID=UPI000DBE0D51|nr:DUF1490 family protein [Nakamurella deserti]